MSSDIPSILIEGKPPLFPGYTLFTEAIQAMMDQRRALVADDWDRLIRLCNDGLGQALGCSREISRNAGVLHHLVIEVNREFADRLESHAEDPATRDEFFAGVKEDLLGRPGEVDPALLEDLDALAVGSTENNGLLERLRSDAVDVEDRGKMNSAIDASVALATRSLLGLTFAGFQSHHVTLSSMEFKPAGDAFEAELVGRVESFEVSVERSLERIYSDLAAGQDPAPAIEAFKFDCEDALPRFGRFQATLRAYALWLREQGKGGHSERFGDICGRAYDATRLGITAYAAVSRLEHQLRVASPEQEILDLVGEASVLPFRVGLPNGKNVEVAKVSQSSDDDFIEVAGFVESVDTGRDTDNKLISKVTLHDPSSDTRVVAAAIFAHLTHLGLSKDSYCRLSGLWKSASGLNDGGPVIQIDKLALAELAGRSWEIRLLRSARRYVERWPGALNIRFGLSPHFSGEEEGESDMLGAGELIYGDFIED